MKYFLSIVCVLGIVLTLIFCGIKTPTQEAITSENYLRIHIRANSDDEIDQNVKYKVKDAVIEALIPVLAECETKGEASKVLKDNFGYIESIANNVLKASGFSYTSNAVMKREYFPTRVYENVTLEEGEYDALVLNLGEGAGNNWWCVVYPAFCFLETKNSDNIVYISRIWDIIKNVIK